MEPAAGSPSRDPQAASKKTPPEETRRARRGRDRSRSISSTSSSEASRSRSPRRGRRRHRRSRRSRDNRSRSRSRHSKNRSPRHRRRGRRSRSRSRSRSQKGSHPHPSDVVTKDMLTTFMNEMKEFTTSFTRERAPVPAMRLNVPDPLPPTGLASAESLSVQASDGAWEEEDIEGDADLLSPSLVSDEARMPTLAAEIVLPSPPETASLPGPPRVPATLHVSEEILFPDPPVLAPSPLVDQVPGLLQCIKREFNVGIRVRPLPPGGPASRQSLGAAGVVVPPSARWEFPMDPSVLTQFQRWSRGNLRDWTSFNKDQNTAIRVFDTDFEAVLRVLDITCWLGRPSDKIL